MKSACSAVQISGMAHQWRSAIRAARATYTRGGRLRAIPIAAIPIWTMPIWTMRSLDKTPVFVKNHGQTKIRGDEDGGGYDGHGGGAARSAAAVALHAQTDNAVVARRLVRVLRSVLHRLYRHRAVQGKNLHPDDPRPVRPERLCQFRRRAVHRPVHRHPGVQLAVRPLRPALDLHLRAVVVLGRRLHHGVSGHRGEHRSVAVDRQHRARRRAGERRRLCVGARAQEPARAGLRL